MRAGLILYQGYVPGNVTQIEHKFPIKTVYFLGVREFTTSSFIVYVYTTTDL